MLKKTIAISLISVLISLMIIPSSTVADEEIKSTAKMASNINVVFADPTEPIIPLEETRDVEVNITYNVERGIALRNIFYFLLKDREVDINLEIIDRSEWCTANFDAEKIITKLPARDQVVSQIVNLSIGLKKEAQAHESGFVSFNVSIPSIKGPFGLITFIDGFEKSYTVKFESAYVGVLAAAFTDGSLKEISPYNETIIPIDIHNIGNGKTNVKFEILNSSDSFNITLDDDVTIDIDKKATTNLILRADNDFELEDIIIKLTPIDSENKENVGESSEITISIKNDGSYVEEEEGFVFDATILIVVLVIIILLAVAYKLLKRK